MRSNIKLTTAFLLFSMIGAYGSPTTAWSGGAHSSSKKKEKKKKKREMNEAQVFETWVADQPVNQQVYAAPTSVPDPILSNYNVPIQQTQYPVGQYYPVQPVQTQPWGNNPAYYAVNDNSYAIPLDIRQQNHDFFQQYSIPYERDLQNLQLVFIVDKSGSQGNEDRYPHSEIAPIGMYSHQWTQWDNTFMAVSYLAEAAFEYDKDGMIPLIFFGSKVEEVQVNSVGSMLKAFNSHMPKGQTNLYGALEHAFNSYAYTQEHVLFIVLTDGQPESDQFYSSNAHETAVKRLISQRLTSQDPAGERLNVLFIRIGDNKEAIQFLERMDDDQVIGKNVDAKPDNLIYQLGPKNIILNAIHEHLDPYIKTQYPSIK